MSPDHKMKTAIIASATGTLLEWYDLFLAVILAKLLSSQLFPADSDTAFLETPVSYTHLTLPTNREV